MSNGFPGNRPVFDRRRVLKTMGAAAATLAAPAVIRPGYAAAPSIKLGAPIHRTGIGASYGRWYERAATAAIKRVNDAGGINGLPLELIVEDDGTDPKRGTELMEKFATEYKTDLVFAHLFSHVVAACAPRAGELKIPYVVCSETSLLGSGGGNRYVLQPAITDVRAQVKAMAPWIASTLGKKVTMIIPDYAFGHNHRDFFGPAIKEQGGEVTTIIAIPPTETSFTRYLPQIPLDSDVIYHVMVGPAVLTFVKELGEFLGDQHPALFGYIDSLEAVDLATPQLEFLDGSYFWEAYPRYAQADQADFDKTYREAVGIDQNGASTADPKDISTASHMFSVWESVFAIKTAMEACNYKGPDQKKDFIAAMEGLGDMAASLEHPQGKKVFDGKLHQVFGEQHISQVKGGKLDVVHTTSIDDGRYAAADVDYTKMAF